MSKIFNVPRVNHELCIINSLMNEMFDNLQKGNINRVVMIDSSIHKSLRTIKNNYSCLTYQTSQISILTFAFESLKHIAHKFKAYYEFIDTQCNIEFKNRDIFDYCDSASKQICRYINNFHYERMKALCSY